ncbi:ABC transporter substrate-binding protein [Paenibacillus swuensis]|uniref:ABC transporter substrate-binding protein n=1 Tax=Paenibacillus swuensis TaxID=1178515 RepID=A0A172TNT7_9BACL|nr:ABC transporter substrate-binding protein [Paenibacillus swuensis]
MKSRNKWKIGSTLLLALALFTGCSGNNAEPAATNTPAEPEKQATGGTLVIARLSDANNLDPHYSTQLNSMAVVQHKVYEGLVELNKNSEYKPLLATEWKQIDDLTWEFKLREGVTFQDGAPFNAAAVQKTIARATSKEEPTPKANMFNMIKEVIAVDDYTIQMLLEYPYAPLLSVLASAEGGILSPKAIDTYGKELTNHPTGTGPYTFESWTPGQDIILVRNDKYWGDQAKLDKVVFRTVPEDATRVAMVETGEAHIAEQLPITEIDRVSNSSTMSLGRFESFAVDHIGFNTKKKPFDDVRVRQAIAYSIDKEAIINGVYNNVGKVSHSTLGPKVIGYSPNLKGYAYDINKAKSLLADAGYAKGFKATLYTNDNKARVNVSEVLQSQLKGIGIDLEVKVMEFGAYIEAATKGETDMFISGWGNATGDADYNQYNLFHSSSAGLPGNHSFYNNPEVDKLIEDGRKEKDADKRKILYEQAQQIELNEVPLYPFRSSENLVAISKNVEGLWISPSGYVELGEIVLKP